MTLLMRQCGKITHGCTFNCKIIKTINCNRVKSNIDVAELQLFTLIKYGNNVIIKSGNRFSNETSGGFMMLQTKHERSVWRQGEALAENNQQPLHAKKTRPDEPSPLRPTTRWDCGVLWLMEGSPAIFNAGLSALLHSRLLILSIGRASSA